MEPRTTCLGRRGREGRLSRLSQGFIACVLLEPSPTLTHDRAVPRPAPCSGAHQAVSPRLHEALSKPSSSLEDEREDERPARRCLLLARRLGGGDRGRRDRIPCNVGISRAGKADYREVLRHSHERHEGHGMKALHAGE